MPWRDKYLPTFLTFNTTWKRYCEVFRKMIFKTVSSSGTIVSQTAQLHKESISKGTAAVSEGVSKFRFHGAIPWIKLLCHVSPSILQIQSWLGPRHSIDIGHTAHSLVTTLHYPGSAETVLTSLNLWKLYITYSLTFQKHKYIPVVQPMLEEKGPHFWDLKLLNLYRWINETELWGHCCWVTCDKIILPTKPDLETGVTVTRKILKNRDKIDIPCSETVMNYNQTHQ